LRAVVAWLTYFATGWVVLTAGYLPNFFRAKGYPSRSKESTTTVKETMMIEENLARLRAHRNNIHRYRRLLATQLTEVERAYRVRRLAEEQAASESLIQTTFPISLPKSGQPADAAA
jgi:hypothetical protein